MKRTPKKKFDAFIRGRKLEDLDAIYTIESLLKKKRGYVFKMPKKGEPVVVLVSGGVDSIVGWYYLMERFGLDVYPLFLHRGSAARVRQEEAATDFFTKFFQERLGADRVHAPRKYSTSLPPKELLESEKNFTKFIHPAFVLQNLNARDSVSNINMFGATPYTFPLYGLNYARELEYKHNLKVRHIFNTVDVGDGLLVPSQTYTALRSTMLSMCLALADWSWNFSSTALERETNHFLHKSDLIRYGTKQGLPLEKTWSCYRAGRLQCGNECRACDYRREQFSDAGVPDKTPYLMNSFTHQLLRKIKNKLG